MDMWNNGRIRLKKKQQSRTIFILISFFSIFFFFFFFSYIEIPNSHFSVPSQTLKKPYLQCTAETLNLLPRNEKFLWFAPHSGFSNQLSELKNAILVAAILNRTLIVPPVLDHHAVSLGSCPKFRVLEPSELRISVWNHIIQMIENHRYVSMADIVDLFPLVASSAIKTVDFRVFVSSWCGLDMSPACFGEGLCCNITGVSTSYGNLKQCGSLLSGLEGNIDQCLYAVEKDCRTTVWTYKQDHGRLDSFQLDKQLKEKKNISFVRTRKDIFATFDRGSKAEKATVLAFGSLFSANYKGSELYIDIHENITDTRINSLIEKIEFLPFVPELLNAGKEFAFQQIKEPFLCAQLRLLDGQFKNHWKTTFSALENKINSLQAEGKGKPGDPLHIFVMTDLSFSNWTGNYLGNLARNSDLYHLHYLQEGDELIKRTAKKVMAKEYGMKSTLLPEDNQPLRKKNHCSSVLLPDFLLYIEETVCSCASLGFVVTAGSTIAETIEQMRKYNACSKMRATTLKNG